MNRSLFVTPGEQEWSVTVAHDDDAVDRYIAVFSELAAALSPRPSALLAHELRQVQGHGPPLPVVPLDFQPAKVCVPGPSAGRGAGAPVHVTTPASISAKRSFSAGSSVKTPAVRP